MVPTSVLRMGSMSSWLARHIERSSYGLLVIGYNAGPYMMVQIVVRVP